MTDNVSMPCFICERDSQAKPMAGSFDYLVNCMRCGAYGISNATAKNFASVCSWSLADLRNVANSPPSEKIEVVLAKEIYSLGSANIARSIISHVVKKTSDTIKDNRIFDINDDVLLSILKNNAMPSPADQANNLLILMSSRQPSLGVHSIITEHDYGYIGLIIAPHPNEIESLRYLENSLEAHKLINRTSRSAHTYLLSLDGWQKVDALKLSEADSKTAFLAMEFPNEAKRKDKDYYFQECLFPNYLSEAVKQTGYQLVNPLLSNPQAGNIHARLEIEIRSSRFTVAELTDDNSGAYWEAGFARGIGKPVIYMCEEGIKPHFDVGSDNIVFYDRKNPEKAASDLKAVIRATLYGEAVMTD